MGSAARPSHLALTPQAEGRGTVWAPLRMVAIKSRAGEVSPQSQRRVVVVMPAYNAERTLESTYGELPAGEVDEVILVDDASRDGTVDLALRLGLKVFKPRKN